MISKLFDILPKSFRRINKHKKIAAFSQSVSYLGTAK